MKKLFSILFLFIFAISFAQLPPPNQPKSLTFLSNSSGPGAVYQPSDTLVVTLSSTGRLLGFRHLSEISGASLNLQQVLTNGSTANISTLFDVESTERIELSAGEEIATFFNGADIQADGDTRSVDIKGTFQDAETTSISRAGGFANQDNASTGVSVDYQGVNDELESVLHAGSAGANVEKNNGANAAIFAETQIDGGAIYRASKVEVDSYGGVNVTTDTDVNIISTTNDDIKHITFNPERIQLRVQDNDSYGGLINIDSDGLSFQAEVATGETIVGFETPVAENIFKFPSHLSGSTFTLPILVEGNSANNQGEINLPTFFRLNVDSPTTSIVKYWIGTQTEYEAEPAYDSGTLYFITDAPNPYYEVDTSITTLQTSASLNSAKPSAPIGHTVSCPAIPSTPMKYTKQTASQWEATVITLP